MHIKCEGISVIKSYLTITVYLPVPSESMTLICCFDNGYRFLWVLECINRNFVAVDNFKYLMPETSVSIVIPDLSHY